MDISTLTNIVPAKIDIQKGMKGKILRLFKIYRLRLLLTDTARLFTIRQEMLVH